VEYRGIIDPDEVITWVDINGKEEPIGATSWANDIEARACAKICYHLTKVTRKSVVIITRFIAQRMYIRDYLYRIGLDKDIKVSTTTGALGTQADITIFSLVRNNPERQVGAAGTLQDLNVSISRSKEKLIIVGNFDMMLNGWTCLPNQTKHGYKSPARSLARLLDTRYGKVIDAPKILVH
jgi:superfamily I DNA and/or RNA helicase